MASCSRPALPKVTPANIRRKRSARSDEAEQPYALAASYSAAFSRATRLAVMIASVIESHSAPERLVRDRYCRSSPSTCASSTVRPPRDADFDNQAFYSAARHDSDLCLPSLNSSFNPVRLNCLRSPADVIGDRGYPSGDRRSAANQRHAVRGRQWRRDHGKRAYRLLHLFLITVLNTGPYILA